MSRFDDEVRLEYLDFSSSPPTEETVFSDSLSPGASTQEHAGEDSSVTSNAGSPCSSPSSQNSTHPKTLEEFWICGQRGEWAFGRFVPMPPPILKRIGTKLNCALEPKVSPIRDGEKHHRYPDIVFYLENDSEPEICFEVVSKDKARDVDLVHKVPEYASLGIPVFVLIDAEVQDPGENQRVIVYSEPHPEEQKYGMMQIFVEGEKVIGHEALMQLDQSAADFLTPSVTREAHGESIQLRKQWEDEQVEKLEREKQRANEAMAKAEKAGVEKEEALKMAKKAVAEKDKAMLEKDKAMSEKDKAMLEKDKAMSEKGKAMLEKDKAMSEKDKAMSEKDKAMLEKDKAMSEIEQLKYNLELEREKSKKLETELKRKRSDYEG